MALGVDSAFNRNEYRNLPGSTARPVHKADNLTAICETIVHIMWKPRRLTALLAYPACYRALLFVIPFEETPVVLPLYRFS
jgi:hypothetical protein